MDSSRRGDSADRDYFSVQASTPRDAALEPTMTTSVNKAIAQQFFERFSANDIEGALNTMTDDATWWIPGKKERSPTAWLRPSKTG